MAKPIVLNTNGSQSQLPASTPLDLAADPTSALQAATKQYVDGNLPLDGGNFSDTYVGAGFNINGGSF